MKPNYYYARAIRRKYGAIFDSNGDEIDEVERGLTEPCLNDETGKTPHRWLLLPEDTTAVREGGKQYIVCLECLQVSHL